MKNLFFTLILILSIFTIGCKNEPPGAQKCGDGFCDNLEMEKGVCPQDCNTIINKKPPEQKPKQETISEEKGVLYLGLMVHLEGWDGEETNQDKFKKHADAAKKLADIFEKHNAKITFEAGPEFVEASKNFNVNVLQELHSRGHGIGVHADVGGNAKQEGLTQELFANKIRQMKTDMEQVTGIEILHVSGICSELDWVNPAIEAGYKFTTGSVGFCAMSLPKDKRPNEYKDCKNPMMCHGVIPVDLKNRIHPWKTSDGSDWLTHDPNGKLIIMPSDGVIKDLESQHKGTPDLNLVADYSDDDIDAFIEIVNNALNYSEKDKVNILYFALSIGSPDIDENFYEKLFEKLNPYIDSGQAEWKSINEMYEEYMKLK